jgi:hypothetical protein
MSGEERRKLDVTMVRPIGVSILSVAMVLAGVLFALAGLALVFMGSTAAVAAGRENSGVAALLAGLGAAAGVIFLLFGGLHMVLAMGIFKLRNVARILTIFLFALSSAGACLGLIAALVRFSHVALAWNVSLVVADACVLWYLLRPEIKKAFGA